MHLKEGVMLRQYALLSFLSYLISCFSFYLILLYRIYLIRSRDLFVKVWVTWYDVTGTLVPIKGPGFHRIPGQCHELCFFSCSYLTMRSLLALLSLPICFPLLSQILYFYFSVFCSALIRSSYLSFHFAIKGCAWFPSRVQQFLCQMTRSWHHASALHFALHCSALVWHCLGFSIDI